MCAEGEDELEAGSAHLCLSKVLKGSFCSDNRYWTTRKSGGRPATTRAKWPTSHTRSLPSLMSST